MDINQIVSDHISALQADGVLEKAIKDGVEKAVMKAVDEQFSSWGGITKQLESVFKESLKVDPSQIDIPTYNSVMCDAIKLRLEKHLADEATQKAMESIEKLMKPMPDEMKTDDFIKMICEYWKSDDPCGCLDDLDEYATVEIEDGSSEKYKSIKIWKQKREVSYLSSDRERRPDVHIYVIDGAIRLSHTFNPTHMSEEESVIVKAYTSGTKLTDIKEYDPDDYTYELKGEYY